MYYLFMLLMVISSLYAKETAERVSCVGCPAHIQKAVEVFWATPANRELIGKLTELRHPLSQVSEHHRENNAALKQAGYPNITDKNYIFVLEPEVCVGVVAGPHNRRWNLLYRSDPNTNHHKKAAENDNNIDAEIWDGLEIVPTYQTVSRAQAYLRAQKYIQEHNINSVCIPGTYIVHFGTEDFINDNTSFVVQEFVPGIFKRIKDCPEFLAHVTTEQMDELLHVICEMGHWSGDIVFNTASEPTTIQFIIFDLEQPNNSNPDDYPYLNQEKNQWNIIEGISAVYQACESIPHLKRCVQQFVAEELRLSAFTRYQDLRRKVGL